MSQKKRKLKKEKKRKERRKKEKRIISRNSSQQWPVVDPLVIVGMWS